MEARNVVAMAGSQEVAAAISAILCDGRCADALGAQRSPQHAPPRPRTESGGLHEVIVTATRRAERLQDVPESITALDTNAIAMRGLQQIDDYARFVPGLSLSDARARWHDHRLPRRRELRIEFGSVSSSALYLDEQPITRAAAAPIRGSSTSSASRRCAGRRAHSTAQARSRARCASSPTSPIPSGFDAWAEAQGSSTRQGRHGHDVSAMVNVPLVDGQAGPAPGGIHRGGCGLHRQRPGRQPRRHVHQCERRRRRT